MLILALETSCDETSAAVVKDGTEVLSNIISSQVEFHKKYGGIVPEIASRKHVEVISPVIKEAMDKANVNFQDIDAVAVTYGPGLVGSLLVGLSAAKAIAWSLGKPLIGVNHLEGHIYANFLTSNIQLPTSKLTSHVQLPHFPFICLLVSGGHTILILVEDHGKYETLGRTRDDAAGEAFDKIARFLNLGYPGGPIIDKLAKEGNPQAIQFKRPMIEPEFGYDFSFSGLKTAVVNFVNRNRDFQSQVPDLAAAFQQAIIDVLVTKTIRAAKEYNCTTVTLAGGVAANSLLRKQLSEACLANHLSTFPPALEYCTDNAAMIACAGYYKYINSAFGIRHSSLDICPVAAIRL